MTPWGVSVAPQPHPRSSAPQVQIPRQVVLHDWSSIFLVNLHAVWLSNYLPCRQASLHA